MNDYPTPTAATTPAMSPYQAPTTNPAMPSQGAGNDISALVISHLVRTRKWVRLCSVMGFIGSVFMVLAGLFMMISGNMIGSSSGMRGAASSSGGER